MSEEPENRIRRQFELSAETVAQLDRIVEFLQPTSKAQVLWEALLFLDLVLELRAQGKDLVAVKPDGTIVRLPNLEFEDEDDSDPADSTAAPTPGSI